MRTLIIGLLFVLSQSIDAKKIVFVDGIYDMAHYGHARSFDKAKQFAAKHFNISIDDIILIVGVNDDENLASYKRNPVMTLEQRTAQVKSFKGVHDVISPVPLAISKTFIEKNHIDLVMHGDDYTPEKVTKYYGAAVELGKFAMYPYEPGISTTAIIESATIRGLEDMLRKRKLSPNDEASVKRALEILSNTGNCPEL